jgi:hypothetical protein
MSRIQLRRCQISCQLPSRSNFDAIMDSHQITSEHGSVFKINGMIAAYSVQIMEAYFYVEVQRVEKKIVEEHMICMGATSVIVKTFSLDYWEKESSEALQSVISFSQKEKCILVRKGAKLLASEHVLQPGAKLNASAHILTKKTGIYVLCMNSSQKLFFYVGKANDIAHRIKQHEDGGGAYCITGEPFTQIDPITEGIFT